jgi:mono/diheme cytochrome c family protein
MQDWQVWQIGIPEDWNGMANGRRLAFLSALAGMAALFGAGACFAQQPEQLDFGRREFLLSCAVCHGVTGKGDGIYRELLKKSPSDLTRLATENSGVFPFQRIYEIIDGRQDVKAHGPRDMPIWGAIFRKEGEKAEPASPGDSNVPHDPEMYARTRIVELIEYVRRLQEK